MEQKRRPDLVSLYDKLLYARCEDQRSPSIVVPPSLLVSYDLSMHLTEVANSSETVERQIAIYSPKMPIVYPLRIKGEVVRLANSSKIEQELLTDVSRKSCSDHFVRWQLLTLD